MEENKKEETKREAPAELSLLQRIAMEGEVSACYETSLHIEDKIYFSYVLLNCVPEEYHSFYLEEMEKYLDKEELDKIKVYLTNEMFPVSIWVNRIIADLKVYVDKYKGALRENHTPPRFPKPMVRSKYTQYIKILGNFLPSITRELLLAVINEDSGNLGFLQSVSYILLSELNGKEDIIKDMGQTIRILHPTIAESKLCSFVQETDLLEESQNPLTPDALKDIVESVMSDLKPSNKIYRVNKIDKVTKQVAFTKDFPTQAKALEYLKSIGKDYPELKERYDFVIVTETQD